MQLNESLSKKRRESSIQTTFKRTEIINSFKEFMKEGGNPDVEELAKKYNIDIESLKKRVNAKPSSNSNFGTLSELMNNNLSSLVDNNEEKLSSSLPPLN